MEILGVILSRDIRVGLGTGPRGTYDTPLDSSTGGRVKSVESEMSL